MHFLPGSEVSLSCSVYAQYLATTILCQRHLLHKLGTTIHQWCAQPCSFLILIPEKAPGVTGF
jgi:hypothetical protein